MFIVEDLSKKSESGVYSLNDYTDKINRAIFDIKKNYFYIGGLLNEINGIEKYKELGYSSIVEYCEFTFGFKKTFTYDLMKVQRKFNDGTIFNIADRFKNYDFSKLVLMSSMNDFQLAKCKSDMTVQELKEIKCNKYSARAENSDNIEIVKNYKSDSVCTENTFDVSRVNIHTRREILSDDDLDNFADEISEIIKTYCSSGKVLEIRIFESLSL